MSVGAVIFALLFLFLIVGHLVIIPILQVMMEPRMLKGASPGIFEVVIVFVLVTAYMLVSAAAFIAAGGIRSTSVKTQPVQSMGPCKASDFA